MKFNWSIAFLMTFVLAGSVFADWHQDDAASFEGPANDELSLTIGELYGDPPGQFGPHEIITPSALRIDAINFSMKRSGYVTDDCSVRAGLMRNNIVVAYSLDALLQFNNIDETDYDWYSFDLKSPQAGYEYDGGAYAVSIMVQGLCTGTGSLVFETDSTGDGYPDPGSFYSSSSEGNNDYGVDVLFKTSWKDDVYAPKLNGPVDGYNFQLQPFWFKWQPAAGTANDVNTYYLRLFENGQPYSKFGISTTFGINLGLPYDNKYFIVSSLAEIAVADGTIEWQIGAEFPNVAPYNTCPTLVGGKRICWSEKSTINKHVQADQISPPDGLPISSSGQTFTWKTVTGAQNYVLRLTGGPIVPLKTGGWWKYCSETTPCYVPLTNTNHFTLPKEAYDGILSNGEILQKNHNYDWTIAATTMEGLDMEDWKWPLLFGVESEHIGIPYSEAWTFHVP